MQWMCNHPTLCTVSVYVLRLIFFVLQFLNEHFSFGSGSGTMHIEVLFCVVLFALSVLPLSTAFLMPARDTFLRRAAIRFAILSDADPNAGGALALLPPLFSLPLVACSRSRMLARVRCLPRAGCLPRPLFSPSSDPDSKVTELLVRRRLLFRVPSFGAALDRGMLSRVHLP